MNDYYSQGSTVGASVTGLTNNKLMLIVGAVIILYLINKK